MTDKDSNADMTRFLRDRGCSEAVVQGGIAFLVDRWRDVAAEIKRGYRGDLDEYLNDMDARQILHDYTNHVLLQGLHPSLPREFQIDLLLRPHVVPATGCLWGAANAAKHGWTAEVNWWYFSHPRHAGDALREDLVRRGLWSPTADTSK